MCSTSQHGISDAESLHNRYMEYARVGAVNRCFVDLLGAKLGEVLKYHLRQKWYDLVHVLAKDLVLLPYSSDATSLKAMFKQALQCLKELWFAKARISFNFYFKEVLRNPSHHREERVL